MLGFEVKREVAVVQLHELDRRRDVWINLNHYRLGTEASGKHTLEERGVDAVRVNFQRVRLTWRAVALQRRGHGSCRCEAPRNTHVAAGIEWLQVSVQPCFEVGSALAEYSAVTSLDEQREGRIVARTVIRAKVYYKASTDGLCAMFDGSSQCTIVLPVECLGYGLVVPFLAYRFALWFRIMKI